MDKIWDQEKANQLIPDYMHGGLQRWIEHGVVPGRFLCAVLQNDLVEAVGRADETNMVLLPNYVRFLWNYAPSGCFGSVEKFNDWKQWHEKKLAHEDCDPTNAECDELGCNKGVQK